MHVGPGGIRTSQSWFVGKTSSLENFLVEKISEGEREGEREKETEREGERESGKDGRQKY